MCFFDGFITEGIDSNSASAGIDFDGKRIILSTIMMILVRDWEYKGAPGKNDFNLFWTESN